MSHHHLLLPGRDDAANPLVLLHGSGGREDDLLPLAADLAANAPGLAIRGAEVWETGFAFFRRLDDRSVDEENLRSNAASLADFIEDFCPRYNFKKRPLAVGFSNGAIMATALLLTRPGLLAGAILFRPLSPFPNDPMPVLNGVPVLLIDGAQDERRSAGDGHRLAKRLMAAGAVVAHHVLPTGHRITPEDRLLASSWLTQFQ